MSNAVAIPITITALTGIGAFAGLIISDVYSDITSSNFVSYDDAVFEIAECLYGEVNPQSVAAAEDWIATFASDGAEEISLHENGDEDVPIDKDFFVEGSSTAGFDCAEVSKVFDLSAFEDDYENSREFV